MMRGILVRLIVLMIVSLFLVACGKRPGGTIAPPESASPGKEVPATTAGAPALPPGHPPVGAGQAPAAMGEVVPPQPTAGVGSKSLVWDQPAGWVAGVPSSALRRAQYKASGPGGDAECAVFYFGPGQGGDARTNALRWAQQFKNGEGRPAVADMKTREMSVNGMRVTLVEVAGTYQGGMGMGQAAQSDMPDYMLLGAIVAGPDANWFFKFTGPRSTLEAERPTFEKMIQSLRRGS